MKMDHIRIVGGECMSVMQMREEIAKVYAGPKWKDRVSHMPDAQVIAVYYSFKQRGKL